MAYNASFLGLKNKLRQLTVCLYTTIADELVLALISLLENKSVWELAENAK
jgi:hypothetical protein